MTETALPTDRDLTKDLVSLLTAYAPHDGTFALGLPGVAVCRNSTPDRATTNILSQAGLCVVAQGAKRVLLGEETYEYDPSRMAFYAMSLPVEARVLKASPQEPYLCLTIDFGPQRLLELTPKVYPHGVPSPAAGRSIHTGYCEENILSAALRLVRLAANPRESELLAPLVIEEILLRLLLGPLGPCVAQLGTAESSTNKIRQAIAWIKDRYAEYLSVPALAELVNMSESSFHRHFRAVTSMSPVQFQKILRLQKAKSFMLTEMMDAKTASQRVGYASPSQFSREYSRHFGSSPTRDISHMRQSAAY